MIVLIPTCDTITAPQMAKNFCDHIWKQIISDRGTQYAAQFMKDLHKLTNTTTNISTAYHPQTDGQTERINPEIKQYLGLFINFSTDRLEPMAFLCRIHIQQQSSNINWLFTILR
jgi:hypothetical protein